MGNQNNIEQARAAYRRRVKRGAATVLGAIVGAWVVLGFAVFWAMSSEWLRTALCWLRGVL
jgi:hypothetical protein